MSTVTLIDSQIAYCRAARRLRSQCSNRPAQLYRSLCRLSQQADRMPRAATQDASPKRAPLAAPDLAPPDVAPPAKSLELTPAAMQFIPVIRKAFDGVTLRYSERQRLIGQAERLGIGRFHANLLIALVQHELQKQTSARDSEAGAPASTSLPLHHRLVTLVLMLVAEGAGILLLWNVHRH